MSEPTELELAKMTLADIRKRAEEEAAKPTEEVKDPETVNTMGEWADQENSSVYRREIDLGDGSGVQVFEASSLEALVDRIADAQLNATKKIRSQEAELRDFRARHAEKPKPKELSADEEYVLSQELTKTPSVAFRKLFKESTGMDLEELQEVKKEIDGRKQASLRLQAMETFLATHDDFENANEIDGRPNPNGDLMRMKLAELGLPVTSENLHRAYLDLKPSGLLKLKSEEAHAEPAPKPKATERIAQPEAEVAQQRTRKGSGVSTQARAVVSQSQEPSEDEAYTMPMEKLRNLANRQLAAR